MVFMEEPKIIYKNNDWMVVDKPPMWVTTNENSKTDITLENWLANKNLGNKEWRQGIVNRLDKGTSGLVVVALNYSTWLELKKKFKDRKVNKQYWALVAGEVVKEGKIQMPIGRKNGSFGKFGVNEEGKSAWTEFRRIGLYKLNNKKYSLVEIDLKTGRTHQIRVHFSFLRWPLVGDRMYGGEKTLGRPWLHSRRLVIDGVEVISELPSDLIQHLSQYEKI